MYLYFSVFLLQFYFSFDVVVVAVVILLLTKYKLFQELLMPTQSGNLFGKFNFNKQIAVATTTTTIPLTKCRYFVKMF